MGFIHDRVAASGFEVYEYNADHAPSYAKGRFARFGFGWSVFRHIRKEFRAGRPYDVVNLHEPNSGMVCALKRWCGSPLVIATSHGVEQRAWELSLEELTLRRSGPSKKTRIIYPATQLIQSNFGLRKADHIFCLNEEDKAFIQQRYRRLEKDITRICPAADMGYSVGAINRDYRRFKTILFAGTWRKNKGVEDMVPAFESVFSQQGSLKLVVLGAGYPAEYVLNQFPSKLRSRVDVIQSKSEPETIQAFASADMLVLPSLFEGTPLVLMEAMMSGLPIVTTATCGMKDVIMHQKNGLLIPTRSPDAIAQSVLSLQNNGELRERLGRAAYQSALVNYTWDKVAEPVVAAYKMMTQVGR